MKATGIVRKLDDLGRITLPKELRRTMEVNEGDPLEIYVEDEAIVLKKYSDARVCVYCNGKATQILGNKGICDNCIHIIKYIWED